MKTRTIDGVRITCQMPAMLSRNVSLCGVDFTPGGSSVTISQTSTPISGGADADAEKRHPPAEARGGVGQRRGREDRAKGTQAKLDPGEGREPLRRKPARIERDRRHQERGGAEAQHRARGDQAAGLVRHREQHAAQHCEADRHQHAEFRAEAVERHAERQLRRREHEEIDAGEQPELDRRQPDLGGEIGRDHADRIAQELADDVEHAERRHDRNGDRRQRIDRASRRGTAFSRHPGGLPAGPATARRYPPQTRPPWDAPLCRHMTTEKERRIPWLHDCR